MMVVTFLRKIVGDGDEGSTDRANPVVKAKGIKKRKDPFRGRRRMKSNLEQSLMKSRRKNMKSTQVLFANL